MNGTRKIEFATIACLLIAFGLRLAVIAKQWDQLDQDRDAYLGIATSLYEGRGFSSPNGTTPTAFRPPLYPVLLSIGFHLAPQAAVVATINMLAGLLTVWLTSLLGNALQLGPLRFVAVLVVAIDPLLLSYTAQPMTECLSAFLAVLWLWSVIAVWPVTPGQHSIRGVFSGLAFGLLVLCRPTFWLVAAVCGIYFVCTIRSARKVVPSDQINAIASWSWSAVGVCVAVAPWVIRNWIAFGIPILTTTHGGYTLLLGNNPTFNDEVVQKPWGTVWQRDSLVNFQSDLESRMERDLGPTASELERDQWHSTLAKRFITSNPVQFGEAVVHRVRSLWNIVPQREATESPGGWILNAVGWFYAVVLVAAGIGMICVIRRRTDRIRWLPLYALVASIQLAHLVYWTNTRMRAPLTPAIALFAVVAISRDQRIAELNRSSNSFKRC